MARQLTVDRQLPVDEPRDGGWTRDAGWPRNSGLPRDAEQALAVDRIRCDGYGMCAELLPELIELDDWGYPILAAGTVTPALLPLARRAVETCPVLALRLVSRTGAPQRQLLSGPQAAPSVFVGSR